MPKLRTRTRLTTSSSSSLPRASSRKNWTGGIKKRRGPSNKDSEEPPCSSSSKLFLNNRGRSPDITEGVPVESSKTGRSSTASGTTSSSPPPQTGRVHARPRSSSPKRDSSGSGLPRKRKLRNSILAQVNNQEDKGNTSGSSVAAIITGGEGVGGEPETFVDNNTTAEQLEDEGNIADDRGDGDGAGKKKKRSPFPDHITTLGGDPPIYQCNPCQRKFKTKANIKYHKFCLVRGDKPFKCGHDQCGQGFVSKSHYEYHLRTHTGEKPYHCQECGKGFNQRSKVKRHLRSHTGEKPSICQECYRAFSSAQALRTHTMTHTGERPYACTYCSKRFTGSRGLKNHVLIHTGVKFGCDHCGKAFGLKCTLDKHMRAHLRKRPHPCDQCDKAFTTSKDLRRHLIIHTGERPFKCSICGTTLRRKDNLDRHIKNHHNVPKDVSRRLANDAAMEYLKNNSSEQSLVDIPKSNFNSAVISNIIDAHKLSSTASTGHQSASLENPRRSSVHSATSYTSLSPSSRLVIMSRASRAKEKGLSSAKERSLKKPGKGKEIPAAAVPVSTSQSTSSPTKRMRHPLVDRPPSPDILAEASNTQGKEQLRTPARNDWILSLPSERRPTLELVSTPNSSNVEESARDTTPSPAPQDHKTLQENEDDEEMEVEKDVVQLIFAEDTPLTTFRNNVDWWCKYFIRALRQLPQKLRRVF